LGALSIGGGFFADGIGTKLLVLCQNLGFFGEMRKNFPNLVAFYTICRYNKIELSATDEKRKNFALIVLFAR
jgi:hypothetical protein